MIFVTVGMHRQPFDRLIRKMDELSTLLTQEVIMQIGHAKYVPKTASYFRFATGKEIEDLIKRASLVITHGGLTLVEIFRYRRTVIAVPRLRQYGEHIDDHQLELVRAMESRGFLKAVYDIDNLFNIIGEADGYLPEIKNGNLGAAVKRQVDLLMSK